MGWSSILKSLQGFCARQGSGVYPRLVQQHLQGSCELPQKGQLSLFRRQAG